MIAPRIETGICRTYSLEICATPDRSKDIFPARRSGVAGRVRAVSRLLIYNREGSLTLGDDPALGAGG
jgi:hypothetical protein